MQSQCRRISSLCILSQPPATRYRNPDSKRFGSPPYQQPPPTTNRQATNQPTTNEYNHARISLNAGAKKHVQCSLRFAKVESCMHRAGRYAQAIRHCAANERCRFSRSGTCICGLRWNSKKSCPIAPVELDVNGRLGRKRRWNLMGFHWILGILDGAHFFPRGRVVAIVVVAKMVVSDLGWRNDWGCFAVFLQMRELDSLS